jgi:hypothetical protein
MNIRKLCSTLAKLEKTKSQAKIQAIRSIVGHLSDIIWEMSGNDYAKLMDDILCNGERRSKRRKK